MKVRTKVKVKMAKPSGTAASEMPGFTPILPPIKMTNRELVGKNITRELQSLPIMFHATCNDLRRGYGCYFMPFGEFLQAMTNGPDSHNNDQALVRLDHNNRRNQYTVTESRVCALIDDLCVAFIDTIYLAFQNGDWFRIINPNHRCEAARRLYLSGLMSPEDMNNLTRVYIVHDAFAPDMKRFLDWQTKIKTSDTVRNPDYTGGSYCHHVIEALKGNFNLTGDDFRMLRQAHLPTQISRMAHFLVYGGNVKCASYLNLAHTFRAMLDKAGTTKATPSNGRLPDSVLVPILRGFRRFYQLRNRIGQEDETVAVELTHSAVFTAMYVTATMSGDTLGTCPVNKVAKNLVQSWHRTKVLVASASNHGATVIQANYDAITNALTR